jgi:calcineurin-like phosphoesterase family protein
MYFFTADEHYGHGGKTGHEGIIKYCNRPFEDVKVMDEAIIENSNNVVKKGDIVIHAGDFCWFKKYYVKDSSDCVAAYVDQLNGTHIFLKGSHDRWMPRNKSIQIWEATIEKQYIVVCHYAMRTWARSHYNSWQLYGHSHGRLEPIGKQWDIGVDNNNFFPVSFDQIKGIMEERPDNQNLIRPEGERNGRRRN